MSYTPTNWSSGDTITSTKLNKIEQGIADAQITVDASPTAGSANPVSSGGVQSELSSLDQNKQNTLTFDSTPTEDSTNPVTSGGVYSALNGKQNSLTFDSTPTENSTNPVTSGGVYDAVVELKREFAGIPLKVSGNPVAITDSAGVLPPKELVLNIEPHQDGSGTPSPDNVRPISGYTGVEVTRMGKNLFKITAQSGTTSGITRTVNALTGEITFSGTANSLYVKIAGTISPGTYILSGCPSGGSESTYRLDVRKISGGAAIAEDYGNGSSIFTATETCNVMVRIPSGATISNVTFKPMIRLASITDATFEPYTAQTYPITFPAEAGTVYGGTLNPLTGVLTVDKAITTINSTGSYSMASFQRINIPISDFVAPAVSVVADIYCDKLKTVANATLHTTDFAISGGDAGSNIIRFRFDSTYETKELYDAYLAQNPLTIVYRLTNPVTYQLAPTQVEMLKGANTLWMDADGTIDLTYNGDIKTYIDSKVAELQALILENNG